MKNLFLIIISLLFMPLMKISGSNLLVTNPWVSAYSLSSESKANLEKELQMLLGKGDNDWLALDFLRRYSGVMHSGGLYRYKLHTNRGSYFLSKYLGEDLALVHSGTLPREVIDSALSDARFNQESGVIDYQLQN